MKAMRMVPPYPPPPPQGRGTVPVPGRSLRRALHLLPDFHGLSRNRRLDPGSGALAGAWTALGAAGGAPSDEEAAGRADALAAGAGAGERKPLRLFDLRQCRHDGPLRYLLGSAARRPLALRR